MITVDQYKYNYQRNSDKSPIIIQINEVSTTKLLWIGLCGLTRNVSYNLQPSIDYDIILKRNGNVEHRAKIIGVDLT